MEMLENEDGGLREHDGNIRIQDYQILGMCSGIGHRGSEKNDGNNRSEMDNKYFAYSIGSMAMGKVESYCFLKSHNGAGDYHQLV